MFTNTLKEFFTRFNITAQEAQLQSRDQLIRKISDNYDEDEALEIWEQLSILRESKHVETSEVNSLEFDHICRISSPKINHVVENKYKVSKSINKKMDFSGIMEKLSIKTQIILAEENLGNEIALSRISNDEIKNLSLNIGEKQMLVNLVVQCRINALTQKPENALQNRFPLKSIITKKVLKKNGLDNCFKLYFLTYVKTIHALFQKYPSIPLHDRKNILAAIALARYIQKPC
jgi:hypothetical protein